ncbi:MAG: hypothetical protein KGZ50_04585 [Peptococcaceae bacterium]|nr:hypothetical protein [Peptococcaceae bacterium]
MSKLLFTEYPIVVSKELANLLGLNEAIVLQQIHYWLEINRKAGKHFHEGRHWTYNSIRNWHEENFEFWSFDTVKRTFAKLESAGLLLSGNFNKEPMDKTKWYSINEEELERLQKSNVPKTNYDEKTPEVAAPPIEAIHYPTPNEEVYCPAPYEPMQQLTPIGAKCTNALGHSIGAKCTNGLVQNALMDWGKMHQAIPETSTETSPETSKISIGCLDALGEVMHEDGEQGHKRQEPVSAGHDDGYSGEFEEFWSVYPRTQEKKAAYGQWKARLKEKHKSADLIAAAREYAKEVVGKEQRFIKQAKTFLGANKPFVDHLKPLEGGRPNEIPRNPEQATGTSKYRTGRFADVVG